MRPSRLRKTAAIATAGATAVMAAGSLLLGAGVAATFTNAASTAGGSGQNGPGTAVTSPTLTGTNAPSQGMSAFTATRSNADCALGWSAVSGDVPDRIEINNGQRVVTTADAHAAATFTDATPGLKAQTYTVITRKGENWTSPANLARTATCPAAQITAATGAWESLSGDWTTSGTRQVTTTPGAQNPIRAVDAGTPDADLSINTAPTGGGDSLVVRASDEDNYLRARTSHTQTTYAGTARTGSYQQAHTGTREVNVGRWVWQPASTDPRDSDYMVYGWYWYPDFRTETYTYYTTEYYTYYSCDQGGSLSGTTCTRQDYSVTLEKVADSKPTTLWTWISGTAETQVTNLRLRAAGTTVQVYVNGAASPSGQVTETFNQAATKHGVSYADSPSAGSLLDGFSMVAA